MTKHNSVCAIVVNWNNFEDTADCIRNVKKQDYDSLQVLVIDNGSTDGSREQLISEFSDVKFVINDYNRGFPGALTDGLDHEAAANSDYIWIINNDVNIPDESVLRQLQTTLVNCNADAISPLILTDNKKIWFRKGKINERTGNGGTLLVLSSSEYRLGTPGPCRNESRRLLKRLYPIHVCPHS